MHGDDSSRSSTVFSTEVLFTSDSEAQSVSWVEWFVSQQGQEYFVEVDEEFIQDGFNTTGLSAIVPGFKLALQMILDEEMSDVGVDANAKLLYGLIHARFILSQRGILLMREKFAQGTYGTCVNTACDGQMVMPIGLSDTYGIATAKVFCPRCNECYHPQSTRLGRIDGSFFGTTFAPFFFLTNPELVTGEKPLAYVPRIYGFKVHAMPKSDPPPIEDNRADDPGADSFGS